MVVKLVGIDVSEYVQGNSFSLSRAKNDFGQVLINSIPQLIGIDTQGFWNPQNPISIFYGINDLTQYDLKIYNENTLIFDGYVQKIEHNPDGTATISLQSGLQTLLDKNLIYSTGGVSMSPADIFVEICELYKIAYDSFSVNQSKAIYNLNNIKCSANILKPNTSIMSVLQLLSQTGLAAIFSVGNVLYYETYTPTNVSPTVTFSDSYNNDRCDILSPPQFQNLQKELPSGYSITYNDISLSKNDLTEQYGSQSNAFSLSGGINDLITIDSLQSAVWLGDNWLEYLQRSETICTFDIPTRIAQELQISYPIRLELSDGTDSRTYVIRELTTLNNVQTTLVGGGNESNN